MCSIRLIAIALLMLVAGCGTGAPASHADKSCSGGSDAACQDLSGANRGGQGNGSMGHGGMGGGMGM